MKTSRGEIEQSCLKWKFSGAEYSSLPLCALSTRPKAFFDRRSKSFSENLRRRIDSVIPKTYAGGLAWPISNKHITRS